MSLGASHGTAWLLDKAADIVAERGLHKGELWPGAGDDKPYVLGDPCCTIGAIMVADGDSEAEAHPSPAAAAAMDAVRDKVGISRARIGGLSIWSDREDTTADMVIDAMRRTAKRLREQVA